jgi:putative ABC transport system permease protein
MFLVDKDLKKVTTSDDPFVPPLVRIMVEDAFPPFDPSVQIGTSSIDLRLSPVIRKYKQTSGVDLLQTADTEIIEIPLEARAAPKGQFTTLLLGLGAVALLVGAIGIANIMVISVLERRGEIGLRRALGATRRHISTQFLAESALLAALGGIVGLILGALATLIYALAQSEPWVVPIYVLIAAPAAGFVIGAIAGLYPATKAARLSPTEALRAT